MVLYEGIKSGETEQWLHTELFNRFVHKEEKHLSKAHMASLHLATYK